MKKLAIILFFLLLGNCAIHLWGADCTYSVIVGLKESINEQSLSESQPAGKGNISANLYTAPIPDNLNNSKTGKGGISSKVFQHKADSTHQTRYLYHSIKKGALIIHSARSADRYVLELERIII